MEHKNEPLQSEPIVVLYRVPDPKGKVLPKGGGSSRKAKS